MKLVNNFSFKLLFFLTLIGMISCGRTDDSGNSVSSDDPSNLTVDVSISQDQSGRVSIQAKADNAVSYEFDLGTPDGDKGTSEDGSYQYVYANTGLYTLVVKAYGSSGRFVKNEQQLNVVSGEPVAGGEGYSTPLNYEGWDLIWNDEFEGLTLNQSEWCHDIGNGCPDLCGWGNNELEYYRAQNSWVENGFFTIQARDDSFQNNDYTSTKIKTQGKFAFKYGRVDVRAKLPAGKGMWPAIWMLGQNINSVGWPRCGEIDIMEMIGGNGGENKSYGTAHWNNADNDHASFGDSAVSEKGLDQEFHVYSIIWDVSKIVWLLDDEQYHSFSITGADKDAFHKPFYFILNVAVGGDWPGSPDASTDFPQEMQVDYVRVFQEQ